MRRFVRDRLEETSITRTPPPAPPETGPHHRTVLARTSVRRSRTDRVVAGVAGGLARQLRADPAMVRLAFVALAVAGGVGLLLYGLAWSLVPEAADDEPPVVFGRRQTVGVGLAAFGLLLAARAVGLWVGDSLGWPIVLAAAGTAVLWGRTEPGERARWSTLTSRLPGNPLQAMFDTPAALLRVAVGILFITAAMGVLLAASNSLATAGTTLLAVLVAAAGVSLVLAPWLVRLARQVSAERSERIRSEEREAMAAHLHDSVLQTLALIQRNADNPRTMVNLARAQERELRSWLYGTTSPDAPRTLKAALDAMAEDVEQRHDITVDVVVVGDGPLTEPADAVVAACREAATNAGKHSGAPSVSVYVEVEASAIAAYVHDRGRGFDPATIPADRRGIRDSIRGRIARLGGTVELITGPGEGTEIEIRVPRPTDDKDR